MSNMKKCHFAETQILAVIHMQYNDLIPMTEALYTKNSEAVFMI